MQPIKWTDAKSDMSTLLRTIQELFWFVPGKLQALKLHGIVLMALILVHYFYLLLRPFFSRASASDPMLMAARAAATTPAELFGAGAERLATILPIRFLAEVLHFSPGVASTWTMILAQAAIVLLAMFYCYRLAGLFPAILSGALLSCASWHLLKIDLHADQIATAWLLLTLVFATEAGAASKLIWGKVFTLLAGVSVTFLACSKPNFAPFIFVFAAPLILQRSFRMLFRYAFGVLLALALMAILLGSLFSWDILRNYPEVLYRSLKLFTIPDSRVSATNWYEGIAEPSRFFIGLYPVLFISQFRRQRGVLAPLILGWGYFVSLMMMSVVSPNLEMSSTYLCTFIVCIVIGGSLALGSNCSFQSRRVEFLLGLAVVSLFFLGNYLGIHHVPGITTTRSGGPAVALLLLTHATLAGIVLWKSTGSGVATIAACLVLAVPQTGTMAAWTLSYVEANLRNWTVSWYEFVDQLPDAYLVAPPILLQANLQSLAGADSRVQLLLWGRVIPVAYSTVIFGPPQTSLEFNGKPAKLDDFQSIITDTPDVYQNQGFAAPIHVEGTAFRGSKLYFLKRL